MATPVGHYLLGLSIAQLLAKDRDERKQSFWLATIACLPDLDVIPGILVGKIALFHHGASHSFLAAALFSVASLWILRRIERRLSDRLFLLLFLLYGSHLVLDYLTLDTGVPIGIPLFWPWSHETYQSPWLLLPNVQHTRGPVFSEHNLLLMMREAVVFLPLVGLTQALRSSRERSTSAAAWLYGAWFVVAASGSFLSLRGR